MHGLAVSTAYQYGYLRRVEIYVDCVCVHACVHRASVWVRLFVLADKLYYVREHVCVYVRQCVGVRAHEFCVCLRSYVSMCPCMCDACERSFFLHTVCLRERVCVSLYICKCTCVTHMYVCTSASSFYTRVVKQGLSQVTLSLPTDAACATDCYRISPVDFVYQRTSVVT